MPAALKALLASGEVRVSGLLCPGHVTTIIGAAAYDFIPAEFGLPCAVTGFEPVDMLLGIESILRQLKQGKAAVDNVYTRAVQRASPTPGPGNCWPRCSPPMTPTGGAWEPSPAAASGSGKHTPASTPGPGFPRSGSTSPRRRRRACRCGEVLRGVLRPVECPLFAQGLHPGPTPGPLHGLHRRRLRRGVPV